MANRNFRKKCPQKLDQWNPREAIMSCAISYIMINIAIYLILGCYSRMCSDPFFDKQWSLKHDSYGINAQKMWDYGNRFEQERSVTVAIIDTGVDFSNAELDNRMWYGHKKEPDYDSYHGTMCAEIIAANHNSYGIKGIASFIDLKIMSLKALSSQHSMGSGSIEDVIKAIKTAERNGADICNLSLGTNIYSPELYSAIRDSNMLFITSSGNAATFRGANVDKKPYYPACFELNNLISVTSIDQSGAISTTANYGQHSIDLVAPGDNIPVVQPNGDLIFVNGTSFAVPHVTGVAAVLYAFDASLTACRCKGIICDSVRKNESFYEKCKTSGILDGYAALKTLIQDKRRGDYL